MAEEYIVARASGRACNAICPGFALGSVVEFAARPGEEAQALAALLGVVSAERYPEVSAALLPA